MYKLYESIKDIAKGAENLCYFEEAWALRKIANICWLRMGNQLNKAHEDHEEELYQNALLQEGLETLVSMGSMTEAEANEAAAEAGIERKPKDPFYTEKNGVDACTDGRNTAARSGGTRRVTHGSTSAAKMVSHQKYCDATAVHRAQRTSQPRGASSSTSAAHSAASGHSMSTDQIQSLASQLNALNAALDRYGGGSSGYGHGGGSGGGWSSGGGSSHGGGGNPYAAGNRGWSTASSFVLDGVPFTSRGLPDMRTTAGRAFMGKGPVQRSRR